VKTKCFTPWSRAALLFTSSLSAFEPGPRGGIDTQKTPWIGTAAALKIVGLSFKSPLINSIFSGAFEINALADPDSVLRVSAKIVMYVVAGGGMPARHQYTVTAQKGIGIANVSACSDSRGSAESGLSNSVEGWSVALGV